MRALKTKFPCRQCGEPCEVRRLDEGPHVSCSLCSERSRHASLATWQYERAQKLFTERNGSTEYVLELATLIAEPVELLGSAAKHGFKAAWLFLGEPKPNPVYAARWVRAANSWLKWAASIARQLRELTAREADLEVVLRRRGLKIIDGGRVEEAPNA